MNDDWVTIIHPETEGTAVVHRGSLPHHYRGGWRLLTDEEEAARAAGQEEPEPEPVTRAEAAKTAKGKTASAEKVS